MKHVLIFEKEEQAQIHAGGLVQVDGKTWIQFEGAKRRVKVVEEAPPEERQALPAPAEWKCAECGRHFGNKLALGVHRQKAHGVKSVNWHKSHETALRAKALRHALKRQRRD